MAQAFDGFVRRQLAGANLSQELANGFGIQAEHSAAVRPRPSNYYA
jgi:hypothetical protein